MNMDVAAEPPVESSVSGVDLATVLGPPMTDPVARAAFRSDPVAFLKLAGITIPGWLEVCVIEQETPSLTIALAPILDEGEIAEVFLDSVNGGGAKTVIFFGV